MRVVGECFFWYRLTRVFPDKFHRAVKRLCVCVFKILMKYLWCLVHCTCVWQWVCRVATVCLSVRLSQWECVCVLVIVKSGRENGARGSVGRRHYLCCVASPDSVVHSTIPTHHTTPAAAAARGPFSVTTLCTNALSDLSAQSPTLCPNDICIQHWSVYTL